MIRQATASASAEAVPPIGAQVLDALRDLPGLVHACVLDGDRVVVETGDDGADGGTAALLVAWARRASAVSSARGRDLEDVIVSTASADHLVRWVPGAGALWVGVRVDRAHGNLALARRRLARAVRAGTAPDVVVTRGTPVIEPVAPDPPAVPGPRVASEPRTWRRTALVEPITVPPPALSSQDLFTPVVPTGSLAPLAGTEAPSGPVYALARLPEAAPEGGALPQRRPGASAPPPAPPSETPPRRGAQGAHRERSFAAGSRWRRDEGTLRRLLVGLRRLA